MKFTKLTNDIDFTWDDEMATTCYDTMSVKEIKDDLEVNGMSTSLLDFMDVEDIIECFGELVARVTTDLSQSSDSKLMEIEAYISGMIEFYVDQDKKNLLK